MQELINPNSKAFQLRLAFKDEWPLGKKRQDKVKEFLLENVPGIEIEEVGFGANTTELLYTVNHNPGDPDLKVTYQGRFICFIEVTGGKNPYPRSVLVRTDKMEHARRDPYSAVWFCHVCGPEQETVFCHDRATLLKHEFDVRDIERNGMICMRAVQVPLGECKTLKYLARWIKCEVDILPPLRKRS